MDDVGNRYFDYFNHVNCKIGCSVAMRAIDEKVVFVELRPVYVGVSKYKVGYKVCVVDVGSGVLIDQTHVVDRGNNVFATSDDKTKEHITRIRCELMMLNIRLRELHRDRNAGAAEWAFVVTITECSLEMMK